MSFSLLKNLIYLKSLKTKYISNIIIVSMRRIYKSEKNEDESKKRVKSSQDIIDDYFNKYEWLTPPKPNPEYQIPEAVRKKLDEELDEDQLKRMEYVQSHPLEMKKTPAYGINLTKHKPGVSKFVEKYNSDRMDFSGQGLLYLYEKWFLRAKITDQRYLKAREDTLGPDLAIAHFIISRKGAVKTINGKDFIRKERGKPYYEKIPCNYDPSFKVEAVDASGADLIYEGLSNFSNLKHLKWLSFNGTKHFDNWFLDRLTYLTPDIEYLDLSYCNKINHYALACLYRFRNLQTLNLEGIVNYDEFKFACLMYESENPRITIQGIVKKTERKSIFKN